MSWFAVTQALFNLCVVVILSRVVQRVNGLADTERRLKEWAKRDRERYGGPT